MERLFQVTMKKLMMRINKAGPQTNKAVMEDLNTPPCGRSGVSSTPETDAAVVTEEQWQVLRNILPSNMRMEDYNEVLEKISAWIKVAVKEVVLPALETGPLVERYTDGVSISSSSREVERGEMDDSPSQVTCSQGHVEESRRSRLSLLLISASSSSRFDVAAGSSTTPLPEPLRTMFGILEDKIFSLIYEEVTRVILNMLPPEIKQYLSVKATVRFMSAIVRDVLKQINLSLPDPYYAADTSERFRLPGRSIQDLAQYLMLTVMTSMEDLLDFCKFTSWLSDRRGFLTDIHDELDELLPSVTTATVGATVEDMLRISSEETSGDVAGDVSGRPLWHFLQAVSQHITSAAPVPVRVTSPKPVRRPGYQSFATKIGGKTSSLLEQKLLKNSKPRPRCERVLESILFSSTNEAHHRGTDTDKVKTHGLFEMSCETFRFEAAMRVMNVIMSETSELTKASQGIKTPDSSFKCTALSSSQVSDASLKSNAFASALSIVNTLTFTFRCAFEEDLFLKIRHPSTDPALYASQVRLVSEKVLRSTQGKLKEGLLTNLLMRSDADIAAQYSANQTYKLQLSSKNLIKCIIECVTKLISCRYRGLMAMQFLTTLSKEVELLYIKQILTPSAMHLEALSDLISTDSFEIIAQDVIRGAAHEQNVECSWKALDRFLSIEALRQSSQQLIPIVGNQMKDNIAALEYLKAQISCTGSSVTSIPHLSKEAIVRSFVNTATEKLLEFEPRSSGSASVMEADLEELQSVQRCFSELSAMIGHIVMGDLTGVTTSQTEQDHTSSDLQVDVGLEKKPRRRFRFPRFLKLIFKKQKNKACVHSEEQMADKHMPDGLPSPSAVAPLSCDTSIPKLRRKSFSTRLAAFSKMCRKLGKTST
ncbi:uncharacterized protein LOC143477092 isoform X1 [Brachyhypopomus gauderio]|uniref:uncharacterized protein LOC143477092 isoform X1 n=1 Tax=Brachyhypopomus gauderio TaxID=698409 RepID=UPI00404373AA